MKSMRLGRFFYLSEFCESQLAARRGIIIDPPQHVIDSIRALVAHVLDPLREEIGSITITSGYRPILLNHMIGGARCSQHTLGQAADIKSCKMPPRQIIDTVRRMCLPVDQGILEFNQWTHLSYGPRMRGEFLKAFSSHGTAAYESLS